MTPTQTTLTRNLKNFQELVILFREKSRVYKVTNFSFKHHPSIKSFHIYNSRYASFCA